MDNSRVLAQTNNLLPFDGQVYDLGVVIDDTKLLYHNLLNNLSWQSDIVTLFGKTHITRRQIVWMGDAGISYRYSGHARQAVPWSNTVMDVKQLVEQHLLKNGINARFNSCLLNYYPSGNEGMGYHADDEAELGDQPLIAALSLGATRKMLFRPKVTAKPKPKPKSSAHTKTSDKVDLYLESGQLIVMAGVTQQHWKHSIAKTTRVNDGRISLTFRRMLATPL